MWLLSKGRSQKYSGVFPVIVLVFAISSMASCYYRPITMSDDEARHRQTTGLIGSPENIKDPLDSRCVIPPNTYFINYLDRLCYLYERECPRVAQSGRVLCHLRGMAYVESGQFEMGCDECQQQERPAHLVEISSGYWIDKHEVTNGEYADFLDKALQDDIIEVVDNEVFLGGRMILKLGPDPTSSEIVTSNGEFVVQAEKADNPVKVSWYGALAFCEAYDKRLLTEAEWEYAARGGHLNRYLLGLPSFRYSGSDNASEVAWHRRNSDKQSHPVGQKVPNEVGIYDMSGNLREWVSDFFDIEYYSDSPSIDPKGPDPSMPSDRVVRGGSWREDTYREYEDTVIEMEVDPERVRVTKRDRSCSGNSSDRIGFRCAADGELSRGSDSPVPRLSPSFTSIEDRFREADGHRNVQPVCVE